MDRVDLSQIQQVDTIPAWAEPFATDFLIQYWTGTEEPMHAPTPACGGIPFGAIHDAKAARTTRLNSAPMPIRYVRIWMTASSTLATLMALPLTTA
jgi:hypothetical protein